MEQSMMLFWTTVTLLTWTGLGKVISAVETIGTQLLRFYKLESLLLG